MFLNPGDTEKLPIMRNALAVTELVSAICAVFQADDTDLTEDYDKMLMRHLLEQMHAEALSIPAKITDTENTINFNRRMENAVLMKRSACYILESVTELESILPDTDKSYLDLLRTAIDAFRMEFIHWVQSIKLHTKHDDDGWGLWNQYINDRQPE
jgi:hypothetical protein